MAEAHDPQRRLRSSAEGRLRRLRGELVLQLFMRRGPLWEAVREARRRWNVAAKVQLPPDARGQLLPEDAPDADDHREYPDYFTRWVNTLRTIRKVVDPGSDLNTYKDSDYRLEMSWDTFLSACVLYDPPDKQLVEFAQFGNPEPTYLDGGRLLWRRDDIEQLPKMMIPPVTTLWSLTGFGDWYWQRIFEYLGERYLEPQGVDASALLEDIVLKVPSLLEEYREKAEQYSGRYFIEVDDYTSEEDVKNAFHLIANSVGHRRGTKPPRDRLKAVQCALLYDQHNDPDPEDRRVRKWSYAKLGEKFGIGARAAKDHVVLGREILEGRDPEQD